MTAPLQSLIDRLVLRSTLSEEERSAILSIPSRAITLRGQRDLVALGEQTDAAYLVQDGVIGRYSQMRNGVRQIVALHITGDMADLCSVALPKTSWAFHALLPTTVLKIAHADLLRVADQYPNVATAYWRDCVADMAVMSEWIVSVARRPAEARLAHLLCELLCRFKQIRLVSTDGAFVFPVTQVQLAEILGLTSIHVNRTIRSLRERGLVTMTRECVTIHDGIALARIAEFDAAYLHLDEKMIA
jgi:CRP-like cAMP-binding protein